jgi:hypothetical protein
VHILSKSTYIKGLQCEKALYMFKKHPYLRDKLSIEQRSKFQRGTSVGILAHDYFPGGIDMTPSLPSQFPKKVKETLGNLNNPKVHTMYEAVFQFEDTLIMLDMLVRDGDKWKAIEVKSSLSLSPTYYNDAALQYYVLRGCKVPLSDFLLMYVNSSYVKHGPIDVKQLFKIESVLDLAIEKVEFVEKNVQRLKAVVALPHSPIVNIGTHCHNPYNCEFLGHCWKMVPQNSFLYSTAIDDKELFQYYFNGIGTNKRLLDVLDPDSLEAHQVEALECNSYYVNFKTLFSLAPNPRPKSTVYLNLLLYSPAVPEFDSSRPYEEMILAFAIRNGNGENYTWNCMDDHRRWRESIPLLIEKLAGYDQIVCFAPQNLSSTLLRHEIIQNRNIGYRVFNLFYILQNADFFHQRIKAGFTLQNVVGAVFPSIELFEHGKILQDAMGVSSIDHEMAMVDICTENEMVEKIHRHFFK